MTTITIDDRYANTLNEFTDVQSAVNIAIKRYIINMISDKISELSTAKKRYIDKYGMDFQSFQDKVSTDEDFIDLLENQKQIKTWETDLMEWEFNIKGIEDWKQKLQNILTI